MNKHLIMIISVYILIFVLIFGFFTYKLSGDFDSNSPSSFSKAWNSVKGIGHGIWKHIVSIDLGKSVDGVEEDLGEISIKKHLLPTSCSFTDKFNCIDFKPNKRVGYIIFKMKNNVGTNIVLVKSEISEGISCVNTEERIIPQGADFYLKLENCVFDDVEGVFKLTYYDAEATIDFSWEAMGSIIVK